MQYVVISSHAGKDLAVVVHDTKSGRVVFKTQPDSDLQRSFESVADKPVVIIKSNGTSQIREKIQPFDSSYLLALLDNCVHPPYKISSVESLEDSHRIDSLADSLAKQYLDKD